jgi:hypothetical protein
MKKIVLAALFASVLMASGNENYVGINFGSSELSGSINSNDFGVDETHYTATLGHYYGDTSRISATYTYVKHATNVVKNDAISVAYDFIFPFAENKFSIYAGPILGYTRYQESSGTIDLDLSGFHYGAQVGAIVRFMDNIEIEAGYRYLIETGSDTLLASSVNADDIKMWYIGANYRF